MNNVNKNIIRQELLDLLDNFTTQTGGGKKKYTEKDIENMLGHIFNYLYSLLLNAENEKRVLRKRLSDYQSNIHMYQTNHNTIQPLTVPTNPLAKLTKQDLNEPTQPDTNIYPDPVKYNEAIEEGRYYRIYKKTTNKKKIIAEGVFRTHGRNNRLPEYLSGLLCTINNFESLMGRDWGYRLYFDINILRKNVKPNNDYEYPFNSTDIEEWEKLFKDRDEGEIFYILLDQLNKLDFVEIFKVELKDPRFIDQNSYPIGLFSTNYRFHASLDTTKHLVYMKDADYALTKANIEILSNFEKSDKIITYYFFPWYKPPTHGIVQYPFMIIAYFWGIKPHLAQNYYSFDDLFDYFLNFNNNNNEAFFDRNGTSNPIDKAKYGSDEIILTDLIFSKFKVKDTFPFAEKHFYKNELMLFYIVYYKIMGDNKLSYTSLSKDQQNFKKILEEVFQQTTMSNGQNLINLVNNKNGSLWGSNIEEFLFGSDKNLYCCLCPLYNDISNKSHTMNFYVANIKVFDKLLNVKNPDYSRYDDNFRNTYIKLLKDELKHLDSELKSDIIDHIIFNHIFTYNDKELYVQKDKETEKHIFNRYYTTKRHLNNTDNIPIKFITNLMKQLFETNPNPMPILSLSNLTDLYNFYNDKTIDAMSNIHELLWDQEMEFKKTYGACVKSEFNLQKGGSNSSSSSSSSGNSMAKVDCQKGLEVKYTTNKDEFYYQFYNKFSPILLNNLSNHIIN